MEGTHSLLQLPPSFTNVTSFSLWLSRPLSASSLQCLPVSSSSPCMSLSLPVFPLHSRVSYSNLEIGKRVKSQSEHPIRIVYPVLAREAPQNQTRQNNYLSSIIAHIGSSFVVTTYLKMRTHLCVCVCVCVCVPWCGGASSLFPAPLLHVGVCLSLCTL